MSVAYSLFLPRKAATKEYNNKKSENIYKINLYIKRERWRANNTSAERVSTAAGIKASE